MAYYSDTQCAVQRYAVAMQLTAAAAAAAAAAGACDVCLSLAPISAERQSHLFSLFTLALASRSSPSRAFTPSPRPSIRNYVTVVRFQRRSATGCRPQIVDSI